MSTEDEIIKSTFNKIDGAKDEYVRKINSLDLKPIIELFLRDWLASFPKENSFMDLHLPYKEYKDVWIKIDDIKSLNRSDIHLDRLEKAFKSVLKGILFSPSADPIDVIKRNGEYFVYNGNHRAIIMILFGDYLGFKFTRANVCDYDFLKKNISFCKKVQHTQ